MMTIIVENLIVLGILGNTLHACGWGWIWSLPRQLSKQRSLMWNQNIYRQQNNWSNTRFSHILYRYSEIIHTGRPVSCLLSWSLLLGHALHPYPNHMPAVRTHSHSIHSRPPNWAISATLPCLNPFPKTQRISSPTFLLPLLATLFSPHQRHRIASSRRSLLSSSILFNQSTWTCHWSCYQLYCWELETASSQSAWARCK